MILGSGGYVGSALVDHLKKANVQVHQVDCRTDTDGTAGACQRYQDLSARQLADFDSIVLVGGHSSVAACDREPAAAFANNVTSFVDLVHKLQGQKLIFASSISVYVKTDGRLARETDTLPEAVAVYDLHKQIIERYATLLYANHYALRFGTVSGASPVMRDELLLNSLVRSALDKGELEVANRSASRPILGLGDLCRAIEAIIAGKVSPGCYNLASTNVRIGEVADYVAGRFHVPCREVVRPNKYDIRVDTQKFERASGVMFLDSVASLVDGLEAHYQREKRPVRTGRESVEVTG
jgi:nucleoside-diphosphate-sugar epimerase